MVGAEGLAIDLWVTDSVCDGGRDVDVIEPPAHVAAAGATAIGPPGVGSGDALVGGAEAIDESCREHGVESGPFLVAEACAVVVCLRAGEIDFLMGDIEVAAKDNRFGLLERFAKGEEVLVPALSIGEASQAILRVWGIDGDHEVIFVFRGQDPPLGIVLCDAKARDDLDWFDLGEEGHAGVAGLVGTIPVVVISCELERELDLLFASFGLLQTEDVGLLFGDEGGEVFFQNSAHSVHIPGNQFHGRSLVRGRGRQVSFGESSGRGCNRTFLGFEFLGS